MRSIKYTLLFLLVLLVGVSSATGVLRPHREELIGLPLTHNLNDSAGNLAAATFTRSSASTGVDPSTGLLTQYHGTMSQVFVSPDSPADQAIAVDIGTYIVHWSGAGSVSGADDTSTSSQTVLSSTAFQLNVTAAGDWDIDVTAPLTYVNVVKLPSSFALGADKTVTGITKANPGVVTITAHGLVTGDYVYFHDLTEMTELNGTIQKITKLTADTFSILDTSGYGSAETTGGSCAKRLPSALVSEYDSGWQISPPPYTATDTVPAEPVFEDDGLRFMGASVVNLLPYSEDFGEWTASNVTATQDQTGPDGNAGTAYSLLATAGNGTLKYTVSAASAATTRDYSIWMKRITGTGDIDLTIDDGSTWTTKVLTTSWQRFNISQSVANPVVGIRIVTDTDKIAIFGAQVTQTSFLAPYIPSRGAATYIAAESLSWPLSDELKNVIADDVGDATSEGTMIVEFTPGYDESIIAVGENIGMLSSKSSMYDLLYEGSLNFTSIDDGANASSYSTGSFVAGENHVMFVIWSKTAGSFFIGKKYNGSFSWDSSPATYSGAFGADTSLSVGLSNPYPFHIKNLRFYPKALTKAQIESRFK